MWLQETSFSKTHTKAAGGVIWATRLLFYFGDKRTQRCPHFSKSKTVHVAMAYLFIVIHVLFVSLLHHLPLPSLLLQSLLDELSHFTLLPRLLSANYKPGKHSKPVSHVQRKTPKKNPAPPGSYVNLKHTHTRHPQNLKNIPHARIQVRTSDEIRKINKHTLTQTWNHTEKNHLSKYSTKEKKKTPEQYTSHIRPWQMVCCF